MKPHAQEAEVLRLLLVYSCISIGDIIAWADAKIMEDANPSGELIEVSITEPANRAAMLSNLSNLAEGCDKFAALRTALGRIYAAASKLDAADLGDLAKSLANMGTENRHYLPEDLKFLTTLNEIPSNDFLAKLKSFASA